MLESDIVFNYLDNSGINHEYSIIARFSKNNKKYIIYKETNNEDIYGDLYEIIDDKIKIIPIVDDKDYDIIDEYLESL